MTADHYATLGVAPTTEDVVIRAAYLALMRRYHPDTNASSAAAARARAITAAYKVLGDRNRRADYDQRRAAQAVAGPPKLLTKDFAVGQITFAVILLLLVPLVAVATRSSQSPAQPPEGRARSQSSGSVASARDMAASCASQATQDQIKRELFHQAAVLRGTDPATFEGIAAQSLIRVDSPVVAGSRGDEASVDCKAFVVIDLPPGITAAGERRTFAGEIGYAVRLGSVAGGDSILLSDGGMIVKPLASVARMPDPAEDFALPPHVPDPTPAPIRPRLAESPVVSKPPAPASRPKAPAGPEPAKPIARAGSDSNLAALDRHVTLLTHQSVRYGDAAKRATLLRTQNVFLARRDGCRSDSCRRDAYLDRMSEVAAIMSERPQPSR